MSRTYEEELKYLEKIDDVTWRIKKGFVNNMKVEGRFYVNQHLEKLMFEELRASCKGEFRAVFAALARIGNCSRGVFYEGSL